MFDCFSNFGKNKCSWCKGYKKDSKKIIFYCKHYNKYICKSCYNKIYLDIAKIPFEERSDIFGY